MAESLRNKTIKGVSWSIVDNIANSGLTFIVGIILARILSPKEFGLIGITAIIITISNTIINSGFGNSLIQKKEPSKEDYNTVFTINIGLGFILYLLIYFLSPSIARFFNEPELNTIIKVISLLLIINSFFIVQRTIFAKNIQFKIQSLISVIASCTSGILSISMALKGFGIWSLIVQQISRQSIICVLMWYKSIYRPKIQFSLNSFNDLFSYGINVMFSSLLNAISKNAFSFIIGKHFSSTQLGYYTRSAQFTEFIASNITLVIQRVSFPVLSSIQDDKQRLSANYLKFLQLISFIIIPISIFSFVTADTYIILFIGTKWEEAIPLVKVMTITSMLTPIVSVNIYLLFVKKRSKAVLKFEFLRKALLALSVIIGFYYTIQIMLIVDAIFTFIALLVILCMNKKISEISIHRQLMSILPIFTISLITIVPIYVLALFPIPLLIKFISQVILFLILYIIFSSVFKVFAYVEIVEILKSRIKDLFYK